MTRPPDTLASSGWIPKGGRNKIKAGGNEIKAAHNKIKTGHNENQIRHNEIKIAFPAPNLYLSIG